MSINLAASENIVIIGQGLIYVLMISEYQVQLLEIECLGKTLRLEGSMAGWQELFWDGACVSQLNANADNESFLHQFALQTEQG